MAQANFRREARAPREGRRGWWRRAKAQRHHQCERYRARRLVEEREEQVSKACRAGPTNIRAGEFNAEN